ncbi:Hypp4376 [Branchiostoma lanceolatum]|uniref:Hypp4376 protein n=1 Tax=Branchiostoma lanceolatum TaxID=7740 RepID=A0A8K0ADC3_BRALA|nr:Hypp4376 [Branchiostoma lanceolatum]
MADKKSTSPTTAGECGEAQQQVEMAGERQQTRPKQVQVGEQPVGEGGQDTGEDSQRVHESGLALTLADPQQLAPGQSSTQKPIGAPAIPKQPGPVQVHPGQQGNVVPATMQQLQDFSTTTHQPINQPALQATVLEKREGGFGGATIRIQDTGLAAATIVGGVTVGASYVASQATQSPAGIVGSGIVAGAMSLAAFYLANRLKTDKAICKAVEKDGHIEVERIEEGSLLVHVKFLSRAGYWILRTFNERIHQETDRTCLQLLLEDELQKIGWTGPIQVGLEGWSFAGEEGQEEEQEAGTEQEAERWELAGMLEKQSVPLSVTTKGDSGLPDDVSYVAAMSISSAGEVGEGPLKWQRASLQKHKDSPTAQRFIKVYRSWEEGAEILTSSGYTNLEGSYLNLNKGKLKQLTSSQLQVDPTDSTCLLLTALQLPYGDSQVQTLQQVINAVLQHGPGDWLYQHLNHNYCYLGAAIWNASPQPKRSDLPTTNMSALAKALSAMASSLMYKQDHLNTVYYTAVLSKEVSETEAIRQWEHFLSLAPECDLFVPYAHYHLATLYNQQQDRQKVIQHFTRGQQREANRLPVFGEVPRHIKDPARKAYEESMAQKT